MAFRPFYEPLKLLGEVIGKDLVGKPSDAVGDYIAYNLEIDPLAFSGSYADLMALISREADACASAAKAKGVLTSGKNQREICLDKITAIYADPLSRLQSQAEAQNQNAKNQFLSSGNNIYIIAAVALILILLVIYL